MNAFTWVLSYAGLMISITQATVAGLKELLPQKAWEGYQKLYSFVVALILCIATPPFLRSLPKEWLTAVPDLLLNMPIQLSFVIGLAISLGSNKFQDILGKSGGTGNGMVSKFMYGPPSVQNPEAEKPQ